MGFKIKNSLTGEFEKLPILTLKGEKGETGGVEEYNKVDYMGNKYETLKQANDANVEYAVKTAIGEFNYLDYDGQHITATDTIEGRAKSAILKGQTLVNIAPNMTQSSLTSGTRPWKFSGSGMVVGSVSDNKLKISTTTDGSMIVSGEVPNTMKPSTKYYVQVEVKNNSDHNLYFYKVSTQSINLTTGLNKFIITTVDDFNVNHMGIGMGNSGSVKSGTEFEFSNLMIIEYQEGMENWDIPYFEGMQSVKMPVLTSSGKNLFNVKEATVEWGGAFIKSNNDNTITFIPNSNNNASLSGNFYFKQHLKVKTGTKYTYSMKRISGGNSDFSGTINNQILVRKKDGTITSVLGMSDFNARTFNQTLTATYNFDDTVESIIGISPIMYAVGNLTSPIIMQFQLEEGTQATPYEPYKSNILTVNEDVELRGIGDVKDELNLTTGELTQRIGEFILDNSKAWKMATEGNNTFFYCVLGENMLIPSFTRKMISNILLDYGSYALMKNTENSMYTNGKSIYINLTNDINSLSLLQTYLANNPIKVISCLSNESVKTVDLSDNHVYSYDNITHYDCSSAKGSLVPTLSVKVPTDVQATIAQQRETIQTLNSENERLNQIQEVLKASMLDSQIQLMNLSWDTDFEVFTLRKSIAPKDFPMVSKTGSNIDKFSQAKFIIENDCPDLEKLNSQIEYYFSKDIFSQEQFEELTYLISIVKEENSCEY